MFEKRMSLREMHPQKLGETHKWWNSIQTWETQEKRGQLTAEFGQNSGHCKVIQGWSRSLIQIKSKGQFIIADSSLSACFDCFDKIPFFRSLVPLRHPGHWTWVFPVLPLFLSSLPDAPTQPVWVTCPNIKIILLHITFFPLPLSPSTYFTGPSSIWVKSNT